MCGIAGYWGGSTHTTAIAESLADRISSRGPDDSGVWLDGCTSLALAHRRLAILDLSPAGHQPMVSPCGRYTLVYNGEIYNHQDLRAQLEAEGGASEWRGHSDTETLLVALLHWGVESTLTRLNGMFAFGFWDTRERQLFLARDRMGEKPLYYGRSGETFLFASELKAMTAHPDWCGQVDRDVLALYMRYSNVPAPWCIYKGIAKLPPAHYVVISQSGNSISDPVCYWDLGKIAQRGPGNSAPSECDLLSELDERLNESVNSRMVSDVPLGAFLSGGYDSTIVAALMQAQSEEPIRTFSIGTHSTNDEAHHARLVADHLGTDHTEWYITPEDAMAVIPRLPELYDEPFADASQVPTFLVSQLSREHVTVALSGDGGDELFAGYNRHMMGPAVWGRASRLPKALRHALGSVIGKLSGMELQRFMKVLPASAQVSDLELKLGKLASALKANSGTEFYRDLVSHWKCPESLILGAREPQTLLDKPGKLPDLPGLREQMLYLDMTTYLPDDILTKVDRASMGVSLETRVPLLDHRLVEFAWRVPTALKYRHGKGKWLLRQVLYRYVPESLMERPKMGFAVPIGEWLRGPLKGWAENLLDETRLRDEGFFKPEPIRAIWQAHLAGKGRFEEQLWTVLMFQAWLEAVSNDKQWDAA
ncbi:asparagine synthase (glutamine-hydrolysing) [Tamilnaduibacter salinus]|uniref:asparagine synthase (glutamine-hydrolyzing) n=1 Tax=Tamilnaduibacter salinus TaxID=1484056 RepID=A0A2U1CUW0_9GAMM|nr:asparagine synthase (glutamine-hydrolyzing) [Tamilnaduibacter salinus]PVY70823.1 asparagine synthase (glutamine-hydrolysing) [Tamilnaduibacter salinus]